MVHVIGKKKVVVQGLDGYIVAEENDKILICNCRKNKESDSSPVRNDNYSYIKEMTKKVALITGITGQDGSYLAELLIEKVY